MRTDPLGLVDLTLLGDDDTAEEVRALCARAVTPVGEVAAVCIQPPHVATAVEALAGTGVRVATVAAFPQGRATPDDAARQTAASVAAGAAEVDVVVPWHDGDPDAVAAVVAACAAEAPVLKAILETGSHPDAATTRALGEAALGAGAHFLKTSTGKVGPGASPEAARVLLEVVAAAGRGGVKVSGGVRTAADAQAYVDLAEEVLGRQVSAADFRIGASSLLDDLLATR